METFLVWCLSSSVHAPIKIEKKNVATASLVGFVILHHKWVKTNGILRERSYLLFDQLGIAKSINSAIRSQPNEDLEMQEGSGG